MSYLSIYSTLYMYSTLVFMYMYMYIQKCMFAVCCLPAHSQAISRACSVVVGEKVASRAYLLIFLTPTSPHKVCKTLYTCPYIMSTCSEVLVSSQLLFLCAMFVYINFIRGGIFLRLALVHSCLLHAISALSQDGACPV